MCVIIHSVYTTRKIKKPLDNINYLTEKLKNSKEENKRLKDTRDRMLLDLSHDIKTPITSIKGFSQALYEGMVNDENIKSNIIYVV